MGVGAMFAAMNTMYAAVSARTSEIGTLRALGFSPNSVLLCFLIESVLLATAAGALGVLLAMPIRWVLDHVRKFRHLLDHGV